MYHNLRDLSMTHVKLTRFLIAYLNWQIEGTSFVHLLPLAPNAYNITGVYCANVRCLRFIIAHHFTWRTPRANIETHPHIRT